MQDSETDKLQALAERLDAFEMKARELNDEWIQLKLDAQVEIIKDMRYVLLEALTEIKDTAHDTQKEASRVVIERLASLALREYDRLSKLLPPTPQSSHHS